MGNAKLAFNYVKNYIEKEGYELLSKAYKNNRSKLKIRCDKRHIYEVLFHSFKDNGCRCPKCVVWKNEEECHKILENLTGFEFSKFNSKWLGRQHLDGYCKELQLAFECNGKQHYKITYYTPTQKLLEKQQERDEKKKGLCEENKVCLVIIPYWEWENKEEFIAQELKKFYEVRDIEKKNKED